jgi:hypothetical protein
VIYCCAPCSVCQTARELKIRKNMPGESFFFMRIYSHFYTFILLMSVSWWKVQAHSFVRRYWEKSLLQIFEMKWKKYFDQIEESITQ